MIIIIHIYICISFHSYIRCGHTFFTLESIVDIFYAWRPYVQLQVTQQNLFYYSDYCRCLCSFTSGRGILRFISAKSVTLLTDTLVLQIFIQSGLVRFAVYRWSELKMNKIENWFVSFEACRFVRSVSSLGACVTNLASMHGDFTLLYTIRSVLNFLVVELNVLFLFCYLFIMKKYWRFIACLRDNIPVLLSVHWNFSLSCRDVPQFICGYHGSLFNQIDKLWLIAGKLKWCSPKL